MWMSEMMTSTHWCSSRASASTPSAASLVTTPSASRVSRSSLRLVSLSSTISVVIGYMCGSRFGEVMVRANRFGQVAIGRRSIGAGMMNERDMSEVFAAAQFMAELVAIHFRHENVRDDGVHRFALQNRKRAQPVRSLQNLMAFGLQYEAEQFQVRL